MLPLPSSPSVPLNLAQWQPPQPSTVVVLAPHPDDFDAIGVTLRHLHRHGASMHLAVLTTGASGVEDGYAGAATNEDKAALREREQADSCRYFGLPLERLVFLRLPLEGKDEASADRASHERVRDYLLARRPDMVFMPHGNDSNAAHRRTYALFRAIALAEGLRTVAFFNRDAKTLAMRADAYMPFGAEAAAWKAEMLRLHDSQQQRNLRTRGHGFDERVLAVCRQGAAELGLPDPYAEIFEIERYA